MQTKYSSSVYPVAPARGRGLKLPVKEGIHVLSDVAPARGRGLKSTHCAYMVLQPPRRPRKGAWIEIESRPESWC